MPQPFDRAAEDLGNSIHFEHVNVTVPDQRLATYVEFDVPAGTAKGICAFYPEIMGMRAEPDEYERR